MNPQKEMEVLADRIGDYLNPRIEDKFALVVDFYKGEVTAAYDSSTDTITVQKAFEDPFPIPCAPQMRNAPVGSQVIVLCFGKGTNRANMKVRYYDDLSDDTVLKAGSTLSTVSSVPFAGYITRTSQAIVFAVPTGKHIVASAAAVTGSVSVRSIAGYVSQGGSTTLNVASFSPVCAVSNGCVSVTLTNSSGWQASGSTVENNTPLTVEGTLTITFS